MPNKQISMEDYIKEIEKENEALPQMTDSETEFFKMKFSNHTLSYQYRLVNKRAFEINESMHTYLKNQLLSKICNSTAPEPTLARGFNLSFEYFDKNMKHITTILVKPSDCKLTE
ncbi:hypothetical protein [Legionella moravica]|nr:hypothetical protein [Legionella moravica]STX61168.1 Uncharacterised protein [Legionella moravica]